MMLRSLFAATLLASACPLWADAPLAWRFSPGEVLPYEIRQTSESRLSTASGEAVSKSVQTVTLSWKVGKVDAEGAATLDQHIHRVRLEFHAPGGQERVLDTISDDPPQGLATMIAPLYQAMTEYDYQLKVTPQGKITESSPPEEVLQTLKNLPGAAVLGSGDDLYKQLLRPAIIELPAGELEVGRQWTSFIELPLTMFGLEAAEFRYEYRGEREVQGQALAVIGAGLLLLPPAEEEAPSVTLRVIESEGEILFDRQAGRVHSASLSSRFDLKTSLGAQETTGEVSQTITVKALAKPPASSE